jgi:hypothetical protein
MDESGLFTVTAEGPFVFEAFVKQVYEMPIDFHEIESVSRQQVAEDLCGYRSRARTNLQDAARTPPFPELGNEGPGQEATARQESTRVMEVPP